uniref:Uncharacterized protein n=1 Tax=Oryza brachyantha TaxID=4533 RepID=J3MTX9_ORYBR
MATLTMQPIGPLPSTQEGSRQVGCPWEIGYRLGGFGSSQPAIISKGDSLMGALGDWRCAAHSGAILRESPLQCIRVCYETARNLETAVEVVEHVAEVTEKLASNVAGKFPENGCLHKAVEKIEYIAEVVDEDAEKVEVIVDNIDKFSDKVDAEVEPVIKELQKEFKIQHPMVE